MDSSSIFLRINRGASVITFESLYFPTPSAQDIPMLNSDERLTDDGIETPASALGASKFMY